MSCRGEKEKEKEKEEIGIQGVRLFGHCFREAVTT
jgi:hypothetical protein